MSSTSFTLFPKLPFELRLKIWDFAMPGPRIVGVGYRYAGPSDVEWVTSELVPSLLHACSESREEAHKLYQSSFHRYTQQGRNYISFSNDTLYFQSRRREGREGFPDLEALLQSVDDRPGVYLLDMFIGADHGVRDFQKIQRMILDIDEDRYGRRMFIWDEIRLFTCLRVLTILAWEDDSKADLLMPLYRQTLQAVARKHPEWVIPEITIISACTKTVWGTLSAATAHES